MRKAGLIVIFGTLLILSSAALASDNTEAAFDDCSVEPRQISALSYTPHGNINIANDAQFDSQALAEGWAGGGNATHPYIIEGYEISNDGNNILISGTTRHFIIRNCLLRPDLNPGINMGLYILMSDNAQVENVTVTQKGGGYYLYDSSGIVVMESKADQCDEGFYLRYCEGAQLTDLEAQTCEMGIYIGDSDDVTFETGSIHDNDLGLFIENSDNVQMSDLTVNDNTYEGILIDTSNYCQLEDTAIYTCGDNVHAGFNCTNSNYFTATNITTWSITQGFWIEDSFQPTIEDSYFHDGFQTGIAIWGCSDVTIRRTRVESNLYYGIGLETVATSLIENCESTYNQWEGIYVFNSPDCTIAHSEIANNGMAAPYPNVYVSDSDNVLLYNNSISYSHNGDGLEIQFCDYANFTENTVHNNDQFGMLLWGSQYCTLDNNTFYENGQDGIRLYGSHFAILNDQVVYNNSRWGISLDLSDVVTITNCEVSFNIDNGIHIESSNDTIVSHCQIYNNSFFGIKTWQVWNVEISHCDIYWNTFDGLFAQNTNYANVSFNDFWENGGGDCEITLDHAPFATIYQNTIIGNRVTQGMYVTWSHNVSIEYNTIVGNNDDGMNIQNSNFTYVAHNNISYNANTGIYLWTSSYATVLDNTIMGNDAFGVYISESHYCTLDNNEIAQNRLDGIYIYESHYLVIEFNDIFDNGWTDPGNPRSGVYISKSDNCTLNQNVIYNNTVHGVNLGDSHDCLLTANTIYGNLGMTGPGCGVYLDRANGTIIFGNIIYDNVNDGIYGETSFYCEITDNDVYNNERFGIFATHSHNWVIYNNVVRNQKSSVGIHIQQCDYFNIDSNELFENDMGGIRFYLSDYCNFTNNLVHHNPVVGVQVDSSNGTLIQGNIIYDNYQWGIHLLYANATRTFGNDFVLNVLRDACEFNSVGPNYWDDGVSLGNYWWGISRTLDNFTIYDDSMVEMGQDNYPMSSMWIDNASSIGFEITSTGNTVTWNAFGHNPDSYEVYEGATILIDPTIWTGLDITIDVDGLSVGDHDLMIRIYHYSGHYLIAYVEIHVTDTTPPVWVSTPVDQEITYGNPLSYQLQATDPSGIASWTVNDTVNFAVVDGLLTNATVLEVGTYNVQITVEDPHGNQLTVTIKITVTEPLIPPPDGTMLLLAVTGGGIAVLVVIIIIAKKKRGS